MKKLFVCIIAFCMISCSTSDDTEPVHSEILPVENAVVPTEFERGEVYDIQVTYLRPTSCYAYNDIYYVSESNERTIAVANLVFEYDNCETINALTDATFRFRATTEDVYVFKFWQGEDDNGDDTYLIIEVPVVD